MPVLLILYIDTYTQQGCEIHHCLPYLQAGEADMVLVTICCWLLGVIKTVHECRHPQANEA